jgi:hypothetical protein
MRQSHVENERGMALAVAIFALVIIGALVAGAFYASSLEQRTGRTAMYGVQARQAAEIGPMTVLAAWDQYALNNLATGGTQDLGNLTVPNRTDMKYHPVVTRLNDQLFQISSLGTRVSPAGNELARSSVATLARLSLVKATAKAAVTVTKPIQFNGNSFELIGNDSIPKGWGTDSLGNADPACSTGSDMAGIRSQTTTGAGAADQDNLFGSPKEVSGDTTVTSDFFNIFGDVSFDELTKNADILIPETTPIKPAPTLLTTSPFRCNIADRLNWGEPSRAAGYVKACSTYFPIIYASGTQVKMASNARGQGLLLIEGDLEIAGGFEFSGLIIAKGGIKISGTGNKIVGALLAQDVALNDQNSISGNTTLQFSSCALNKAIQGSAFAKPLAYRSWAQLH